jgi:hypothetical protein
MRIIRFEMEEEAEAIQVENEMMEFGLAQSSANVDMRELMRKPSVFFASTLDLLGKEPSDPTLAEQRIAETEAPLDNGPEKAEVVLVDPKNIPKFICVSAKTVLMLPFSFCALDA